MVGAALVRRNDEATTEMANIPQKSPNSTEDALSAIREALSVGQPERVAAAPAAPAAPAANSELAQAQPPVAADLFNEEPQPSGWDSDEAPPRRAANDDRASVGQMLQAMRGRPARLPQAPVGRYRPLQEDVRLRDLCRRHRR